MASDRVGQALEARTAQGVATYGCTLDENMAPLCERLQYAYEEALDLVQYLEWAARAADPQYSSQLRPHGRSFSKLLRNWRTQSTISYSLKKGEMCKPTSGKAF